MAAPGPTSAGAGPSESHWTPASALPSPQLSSKLSISLAKKRHGNEVVLILAWCFCSFVYGLLLSIVGPTAAVLATQTKSTPGDLAPVLGMGGICTIIGSIPSGALMDRLPGNPFMAGTLLFQALGYAIMPHCTTVFSLACVYALISFTFNFINTGINVMVIWTFKNPQTLAFVFNTVSAVFGLGGILAPQLVNMTTWLGDGALSYYAVAGMTVMAALLLVGLPSPVDPAHEPAADGLPHPSISLTDDGLNRRYMESASSSGSAATSEQFAVPVAVPSDLLGTPPAKLTGQVGLVVDMEGKGLREVKAKVSAADKGSQGMATELPKEGYAWVVLVPAMLTIFANVSIELGYAAWIFTYSSQVGGLSETGSENMTSMFWLLFVVGRGVAAVLATCVHASTLLLVSMPLAIVGSIVPLMWPGPDSTVASVALVGLGAACGFPSTMSITAQYTHLNGTINGVISMVAGLSMTLMPSFVPLFAKHDPSRGFTWLMWITLFMAVMQYVFLIQLLISGAALMKRRQRAARDEEHAAWHTVLVAGEPADDSLTAPLLVSSSND